MMGTAAEFSLVGLNVFPSPARRARVVDRLTGNAIIELASGSVHCMIAGIHLDPRPEVCAA